MAAYQNPVLICQSLAKEEKLSIGDAFYQESNIIDKPMEFIVAGIYRHEPLFAQYEALVLINDQMKSIFYQRAEEFGYTNLYIKASDVDALRNYLETDYIPGLTPEDVGYFEDYETHMKRMKQMQSG